MDTLPLHPALVHLPLGLVFAAPILAVGLGIAVWLGKLQPRAFAAVALSLGIALAGGFAAFQTGHQEGERREGALGEARIEAHEERAEAFLWGTGVAFLLAAAVPFASRRQALLRGGIAVVVASTLVAAALGIATGKAGGELAYGPGGVTGLGTPDAAPARDRDDD